jgi:hypothetical protein
MAFSHDVYYRFCTVFPGVQLGYALVKDIFDEFIFVPL